MAATFSTKDGDAQVVQDNKQIGLHMFPPLDEKLYTIQDNQATFFKAQTGINNDEELKQHIIQVQKKAYKVSPYPCVRCFGFIEGHIARLSGYQQLLKLGRERQDAIFVDLGSCMGTDARKAIADGFPAEHVLITDLREDLMDLGHELFRTSPSIFPIHQFAGDILDPTVLSVVPPLRTSSTASTIQIPDLSNLSSLNPLHGRVSAIQAGKLFHLFSEVDQLHLARAIAGLLDPRSGSVIFGAQCGKEKSGTYAFEQLSARWSTFCHSPESWADMWDGKIFQRGEVRTEAVLRDWPSKDGDILFLEWCVTRV